MRTVLLTLQDNTIKQYSYNHFMELARFRSLIELFKFHYEDIKPFCIVVYDDLTKHKYKKSTIKGYIEWSINNYYDILRGYSMVFDKQFPISEHNKFIIEAV